MPRPRNPIRARREKCFSPLLLVRARYCCVCRWAARVSGWRGSAVIVWAMPPRLPRSQCVSSPLAWGWEYPAFPQPRWSPSLLGIVLEYSNATGDSMGMRRDCLACLHCSYRTMGRPVFTSSTAERTSFSCSTGMASSTRNPARRTLLFVTPSPEVKARS